MDLEKAQQFTPWLLDTNVFRYKTTPGSSYKEVTTEFWETALDKLGKEEIGVYTSDEVVRELQVQSYSAHPDEAKAIKEILLPQVDVLDYPYDSAAENLVRQASALLSHKFEIVLPSGKMMKKYPGVGDSRILLTGYENDCVIITANVKDFMLYPFLYPQTGKVLYDLLNKQYVQIDSHLYERVHEDAEFLDFKYQIEKYKVA